jgi:hypothetical protein
MVLKNKNKKKFFSLGFFTKNRKGFLLAEETLKILIAVIALMFLVYFLVSIYFAKVNGDKLRQAESLLTDSDESFEIIIKNINEGQVMKRDVIEPKGWFIFSFTEDDLKPNLCGGQNCVCICDDVLWEGLNKDRQQKECSEKGICLSEESLGSFEEIEIEGSKNIKIINIIKKEGKVYFSE